MNRDRLWLALLSLVFFFHACTSPLPDEELGRIENYSECILINGQDEGSLQGFWDALPIPIIIDENFYLSNEGDQAKEIKKAIDTWNSWADLRGLVAFEVINDGEGLGAGAPFPEINSCFHAEITTAEPGYVGIWKIESSGRSGNTRQVGTTTCQILSEHVHGATDWLSSGKNIIGSSIIINYDHYNTPGRETADIQTVALHEMGHVLGLLHSCVINPNDSSTAPPCGVAHQSFINALMFPAIVAGEKRRLLRQNDYNRINCLY